MSIQGNTFPLVDLSIPDCGLFEAYTHGNFCTRVGKYDHGFPIEADDAQALNPQS